MAGERARELRELALAKGHAYREARVGTVVAVIPEGEGGTGLTEDYLRVRISGRPGDPVTPPKTELRSAIVQGTLLGDADDLYIDVPSELASIQS